MSSEEITAEITENAKKNLDEIVRGHRALVCHQLKLLSGIVETHSTLNRLTPKDNHKNDEISFFSKRKRIMAHLKSKSPFDEKTGLNEIEAVSIASVDRKGRLSCPPAVEYFVQAMWEASLVEDWVLLLSIIESSKKSKESLEILVDIGGCSVLREWVIKIMAMFKTEKSYRPTTLLNRVLKALVILPITYEAFLHIKRYEVVDSLKNLTVPFYGEKEIEITAHKLKEKLSKVEKDDKESWIKKVSQMTETSTQNIHREEREALKAKEKEEAAKIANSMDSFKKRPAPKLSYSSHMALYKKNFSGPPRAKLKDTSGKAIPSKKQPQKSEAEAFIPEDISPFHFDEGHSKSATDDKTGKPKFLFEGDEMDVDQFAIGDNSRVKPKKTFKITWADQSSLALQEVREFNVDDTPAEVLKSQAKDQLEHHEDNKWKALVESEREDERTHIGHATVPLDDRNVNKMHPTLIFYQPESYPQIEDEFTWEKTPECLRREEQCKTTLAEVYISPSDIPPTPSEEGVSRIPLNFSQPVPLISLLTADEEAAAEAEDVDVIMEDTSGLGSEDNDDYGQPPPPPPPPPLLSLENAPKFYSQEYGMVNRNEYSYRSNITEVATEHIAPYDAQPLSRPNEMGFQAENPHFQPPPPPPPHKQPGFGSPPVAQDFEDRNQGQAGNFFDNRENGRSFDTPDTNPEHFMVQTFPTLEESIVPTIAKIKEPCHFWTVYQKRCMNGDKCNFIHDNNYRPDLSVIKATRKNAAGRSGFRGRAGRSSFDAKSRPKLYHNF